MRAIFLSNSLRSMSSDRVSTFTSMGLGLSYVGLGRSRAGGGSVCLCRISPDSAGSTSWSLIPGTGGGVSNTTLSICCVPIGPTFKAVAIWFMDSDIAASASTLVVVILAKMPDRSTPGAALTPSGVVLIGTKPAAAATLDTSRGTAPVISLNP